MMNNQESHLSSMGKALMLLDLLAMVNGSLSLKELSDRTGWAKSTIHGLLANLREYRMITQDSDGRYRLGTHLFELGNAVFRQWNISEIAKPHLQSISTKVDESVCIAMFDVDSMLVLESATTTNPMRVITDSGTRLPLHASALGKSILANMSVEEAIQLLNRSGMVVYTPHTVVSIQAMKEEWEAVLKNGYAIENGEIRIGMRAVAAPIFDIYGKAKYAIAVTGLFRSVTDPMFLRAKELIVEAASEITKRLH